MDWVAAEWKECLEVFELNRMHQQFDNRDHATEDQELQLQQRLFLSCAFINLSLSLW